MSFLRGLGSTSTSTTRPGTPDAHQVEHRSARTGSLGTGTLACSRCDAPVAIGPAPLPVSTQLTCPFCAHRGPLRDFLSLALPTRPARVIVRVVTASPR